MKQFIGKEALIFYDDAGEKKNIKKKEGKIIFLSKNLISIKQNYDIIVIPIHRIIRIEILST